MTRKLHITGSPVVVYIHGGYWQELTKNQSAYCVSPLIENGYRVIILDYDLCPNVKLEEIVQQIRKAMKFVFEYAGSSDAQYDPSKHIPSKRPYMYFKLSGALQL